jgi:predicted nucleic acid-binding protein
MAVVVSDTSPIRALAHLRSLQLLSDLFGSVSMPPAVVRELSQPSYGAAAVEVGDYPYLLVQEPSDRAEVEYFLQSLDAGESEALALARELRATIVLMDEAAGRSIAEQLGFLVVGTCGILLRAKQRGLVQEITPLVDDLVDNLGFFMSAQLRAQVLTAAGEAG